MKAVVWHGKRDVRVDTVADPSEAVRRVRALANKSGVERSPLDASTRYLAHVRAAWDRDFPDAPLHDATRGRPAVRRA